MLQSLLADSKLFLILTIISIVLTFADNLNFLSLPKSVIQNITIPIQYGLYKSSGEVARQFEFISLSRRASQENKALKQHLADILSENTILLQKLSELEAAVEQEKVLSSQTFALINARPIGINRFLFIDKGSDDGLKLNQAVVYKNNLIGQISEVSPKKSQILLASDPDLQISAFAQNPAGKAKGILTGQFGSEMLMDKILHSEAIEVGDLVYTEGTEIDIPRGLVIGEVSQVLSRENEVFKQAKVKPVIDIKDLDLVFIITN